MRNGSSQGEEGGSDYGIVYTDELPELPLLQFGNIVNDSKFRIDGGWRKVETYVGYLSERNKRQAASQCPQLSSFINLKAKFRFKGSIFHQLMIRMLKKNISMYEYWFLVNGKPLRFSIVEFALISGLRFTHDVEDSEADKLQKSTLKHDCFPMARSRLITIKEVELKLKSLKEQGKETETRLKLFFVLIIANVLLYNGTGVVKDETFQVCDCLEICNNYDWGKQCWIQTFSGIEDRVNVDKENKLHEWRGSGCPWFVLHWMVEAIQGMDVKYDVEPVRGTEMTYPRMLRWKFASRKGLDNQDSRDFLNRVNVVFPKLKADSTEKDCFYMKNLEELLSKSNSRDHSYKELRDLKCVTIQERLPPNYVMNAPVSKKASSRPSTSNMVDTSLRDIQERQVQIMQIQLKILEKIDEQLAARKLAEKIHVADLQLAEKKHAADLQLAEKKHAADLQLAEQRHAQVMEKLAALGKRKVDEVMERLAALEQSRTDTPRSKKLKA